MTTVVEILSDRLNFRGSFAAGLALVAAISYILLGTSTTVAVRYSAFFMSVQIFISVALLLTWVGKTHVTNSKRGRALHVIGDRKDGAGMSWGENFPNTDAPYHRGRMWVLCGACLWIFACCCAAELCFLEGE